MPPPNEPQPLDQFLQAQQAPEAVEPTPSPTPPPPEQVNETANVINPQGEVVSVPKHQIESLDLYNNGYQPAHDEDVQQAQTEDEFGTPVQQILNVTTHALDVPTFGLYSDLVAGIGNLIGEDASGRQSAREAVNPIGSIVGTALGFANPASLLERAGATALGKAVEMVHPAALLEHAGKAAADVVAPYMPEILAKYGPTGVNQAVQAALFESGDQASKLIREDPNTSAQSAIAHIGLAGALGAGLGVTTEKLSNVWSNRFGGKVGQFIEDARSRIQEHIENPEPAERLSEEIKNRIETDNASFDDVYGAKGLKKEAIAKLLPNNLSDTMVKQAQDVISRSSELSQEMGMIENQDIYPKASIAQFNKNARILNQELSNPASPEQVFNAIQDFKQRTQEILNYDYRFPGTKSDQAFESLIKPFAADLRTSLEDPKVWGNAGEVQQKINQAWRNYGAGKNSPLKQFESQFTTNVGGERIVNPGKIQTYINQTGKGAQAIKQKMLGNWMEASQNYHDVLNDVYSKIGQEPPVEPTSLNFAESTLGKQTAGAKFADTIVKKGLAKSVGRTIAAGLGGSLGHLVGAPGFGALVGEHALGPLFESVLPALAKPFLLNKANASGAKAAINYGMSVTKGEKALDDAAASVFEKEK